MKIFKILSIFLFCLLVPWPALARENVDYWYVKDFQQEIIVNKDSSLSITEKITADCGTCSGKHGIFRVLSTRYQKTATEAVLTPIYLESITDFNGKSIKYQEIKDSANYTISWKIGDPNKTVKEVNYYLIKYQVKNTIRFDNPQFDELYWNLNGNFWDIEIDNFQSKIIFPSEIKQTNSTINYYSGQFGSKDKSLAKYNWPTNNTLEFDSTRTLKTGEGITASVTFPKNIISPYQPTSEDQQYYAGNNSTSTSEDFLGTPFSFIFPGLILIISFILWLRYGRDPKMKTIVPEFGIPQNIQPMEMGMIISDGELSGSYISAAIINLAVKGKIKIEKIETKGFLTSKDDYQLQVSDFKRSDLTESERMLIEKLFGGNESVKISTLRNDFYQNIPDLRELISSDLKAKNWLMIRSRTFFKVYWVLAIISGSLVFIGVRNVYNVLSVFLTFGIFVLFAFLMRQRTKEGAEVFRQILGFKLYMDTAEKYRQQFNEKENIFEKFLPYAMVFGITKEWINKMKVIYGQDYFATYHPVWFTGAALASFDANSFSSAITSMSSNMSSTISSSPSSSGSGGGGFSGGGGGGGGGGGW